MRGDGEYKLFLAVLFVCILVLGVSGVVVLMGGMFTAIEQAGKMNGAYGIAVALFGLLMCGAAAVLFAMLWPERRIK